MAQQLLARLQEHARQRPDAPAYQSMGSSREIVLTWGELCNAVGFWAAQLGSRYEAGETLLISSPNRPEVAVAILAGFAAGLRVFPVSPELSEVELQRQIAEANVAAAICSDDTIDLIRPMVRSAWNINELMQLQGPHPWKERPESGDLILQSSGTTGFPRLVLRRGASIDAVSAQIAEAIGFGPRDRVLAMLPLSHSYGLEHGLLAPVWAGSTVLLGQGLDMPAIARALDYGGATIFPTVPSVIEVLGNLPNRQRMPALRSIYSAGGPLPKSVFDRFHAQIRHRVSQLYGATEVGSVTFNDAGNPKFDPSSVGRPMTGVEIRIADESDTGQILPGGSEGQVLIRANSMFERYLDGPASTFDGFFATGDLGRMDPWGRLTITGRLKLLIDIGGVKVNPLEVESVLREHPDVSQCVVIPVRQSETVYRIKAIATPRDPANPPSIQTLRQLVRRRLAAYKVPRTIELRASLPTTATGKVLRHLVETS